MEVLVLHGSKQTVNVSRYIKMDGVKQQIFDIDDEASGRTQDTDMHRTVLGSIVKTTYEFDEISQETSQKILGILHEPFFDATYLDARRGIRRSTFYSGNKNVTLHRVTVDDKPRWAGLTITLIEKKSEDEGEEEGDV